MSGLKRSTYYYTRNKISKDKKNAPIMNAIIEIYYAHKHRYGYRRITLELKKRGWIVTHKKVQRLMGFMGLFGLTPKAKYRSYKGNLNGTVSNELLDKTEQNGKHTRNFSTGRCNEKWATDISEFHIANGKLYLSPLLDLHNREIAAYDISKSPNFEQTINMLDRAFEQYEDLEGLILHSDQGWQGIIKS